MLRTKMRSEMTPKERLAHWALDTVKFITLLASFPFTLAAYAWPMVVGAVIAHQLRSRGGEILVGFFVFVLFNRKLCQPAGEWVIEHVGDFHAWLDRFDPAICSDDDPAESETPPAPASTLEKYLATAREQQAWANREKEKPPAREKEEQAAHEKAMREERERAAKWITDNMDAIKAVAQSTEKRDEAKQKRTRIIVIVLAAVLVVLLLAIFDRNLLLDVMVYAGMIFFYALFFAAYGSPIFYFCLFVVFRKMRNFKLAVLLSILAAVGVVLTVMYLTKDSPTAEDRPLRYGEYPGLIGF
jgi:uncharacterized membrane protein